MSNENQQQQGQRKADVPISRDQFVEAAGSGNFFKPEAGKAYLIGVREANYVMRDFGGSEQKAVLVIFIDHLDGVDLIADDQLELATGSKKLANVIEEYRANEFTNLFKCFFKFVRTGEGVATQYAMTAVRPRPGVAPAAPAAIPAAPKQ